jgi:hypothetical protein
VNVFKKLSLLASGICATLLLSSTSHAADRGPEINPYECLGRYEAATGNRSMSQVRAELEKRMNPLFEGPEPQTVKAMKACVVAMLKSRLGDSDAGDYYAMAVQNDPEEPGYEFWYGRYYSGFRGARGVIVENAEDHFYAALKKLDAKRATNKYRDYHAVVEEWTRKQLMYSYQEDGVHFLPWAKAYPQHGDSGLKVPSVALSAQFHVSKDTRDFFRNNEMRLFTGEMMFAASSYRQLNLNKGQMYALARAPLRYRGEARARIRQNWIGAIDLSAAYEKTQEGQVNSYYLVPGSTDRESPAWDEDQRKRGKGLPLFTSPNLRELGVGYERVFPLFPIMDFKLKGGVKYIDRQGVIEFLEYEHEKFLAYEARPSFSRFLGPDKLTLDLVWVYMDVTEVPFGVKSESVRDKYVRAANIEYAIYRPFVLPAFKPGGLSMVRAPTRGWYWNIGGADDADVYGTRTVQRRDLYLGTRFEGAGNWDMQLQGTYSTSDIKALDVNSGKALPVAGAPMKSTSFRTSGYLQYRVINPDAIPGINGSVIAPDMVHVVMPVSWDKGLSGSCENNVYNPATGMVQPGGFGWDTTYTSAAECYKTYENVRVGAELWTKFFGTGFGGPAVLSTVGYDYQYFYQLKKAVHNVHMSVRMGWDWHKL